MSLEVINHSQKLTPLGDLFKKTWDLFTKGFWKLLAIAAIGWGLALIPVVLLITGVVSFLALQGASVPSNFPGADSLLNQANLLSGLGGLSIALLGIGLIIFAAGSALVGVWTNVAQVIAVRDIKEGISIKSCFREGWHKLLSYFWVAILTSLAVLAGFVLLIVPGIIFWVWFAFAYFVLVCEEIKGVEALKRSKKLVEGYWWPALGRLALIILLVLIVQIFISVFPLISNLVPLVLGIFVMIYNFVIYQDLTSIKEGLTEQKAEEVTVNA